MTLVARAWVAAFDFLMVRADRVAARHRARLVADARGEVLEIGAGTGLNFAHYVKADRVVAIEPDEAMRARAAARAAAAAVPVDLRPGDGERLDVPDASFDAVVFGLVLCSIPRPERALAEARRVLRPGGELRFYEHVRAEHPSTARWQDRLERPWGWIGRGCHPNRDTVSEIERAGFRVTELDRFDLPGAPAIVRPHVVGVAVPA